MHGAAQALPSGRMMNTIAPNLMPRMTPITGPMPAMFQKFDERVLPVGEHHVHAVRVLYRRSRAVVGPNTCSYEFPVSEITADGMATPMMKVIIIASSSFVSGSCSETSANLEDLRSMASIHIILNAT